MPTCVLAAVPEWLGIVFSDNACGRALFAHCAVTCTISIGVLIVFKVLTWQAMRRTNKTYALLSYSGRSLSSFDLFIPLHILRLCTSTNEVVMFLLWLSINLFILWCRYYSTVNVWLNTGLIITLLTRVINNFNPRVIIVKNFSFLPVLCM